MESVLLIAAAARVVGGRNLLKRHVFDDGKVAMSLGHSITLYEDALTEDDLTKLEVSPFSLPLDPQRLTRPLAVDLARVRAPRDPPTQAEGANGEAVLLPERGAAHLARPRPPAARVQRHERRERVAHDRPAVGQAEDGVLEVGLGEEHRQSLDT